MVRPLLAIALLAACFGCGKKKADDDISADDRKPLKTSGGSAPAPSEARKAAWHEATRNLGTIEVGSKNQFQMDTDTSDAGIGPFVHRFCSSTDAPVPKTIPTAPVATNDHDWDVPTWRCLKFVATEPVRCQYAYTDNGKIGADARYVATATCDPDGDGRLLRARLEGRGDATGDSQRVSLAFEGDEGLADAIKADEAAMKADMERAVAQLESLAALVDGDKGDCAKMGKDMKAWMAKYGAETKALDAKLKQASAQTELEHAYGDRLQKAAEKLMGMGGCATDPDVASALKEL